MPNQPQAGSKPLPDLYDATIAELKTGLDDENFTSVQLVKAYFARIEEVNTNGPQLRAIIQTSPVALAVAAELDAERKAGKSRGPLHGIPILLKDIINTRKEDGMSTTAGSYALMNAVPRRDAFVAQKLREAGAIILAKANLSQWSNCRSMGGLSSGWSSVGGQCLSPFYPQGNPLGSSSGSSVGAAVGLCAGALGAETNGSIIYTCAWNNVIGVRPTIGLVSRYGVTPLSSNHDTVGPITRTVHDAALLLSAIAGPDPADAVTLNQPLPLPDYAGSLKTTLHGVRLGVIRNHFTEYDDEHSGLPPYVGPIFEEALEKLRSLGAEIVDVKLGNLKALFDREGLHTVSAADFKAELAQYLQDFESNPQGVRTLSDIVEFNSKHPELEMPKTYEAQDWLASSQFAPDRDSDPTYLPTLTKYTQEAKEAIDACLRDNDVSAFIFPGSNTTAWAKAQYPQVTVPLGFHTDKFKLVKAVNSQKEDRPEFATVTYNYFPGCPYGMTFAGTAFSEVKLLSYAYAWEQASHVRLQRRALDAAVPKTQLADVMT